MSNLPSDIVALEAERTRRGGSAFRTRPTRPTPDSPGTIRRRRRVLLDACRELEDPAGGDAA